MKSLGAKTLLFPTPVLLIGSYDDTNIPNLMNVAWGGVCCSQPPCVCISLREATYSYHSIMKRKAFTVNIPSAQQVREADYVGIYSGREEDKFVSLGLSHTKSNLVDAPYSEDFPLVLECKVIQVHKIGLHTQFIGEIIDVKVNEEILSSNGSIDLRKLNPMAYIVGERAYFEIGKFIANAYQIGLKQNIQSVE